MDATIASVCRIDTAGSRLRVQARQLVRLAVAVHALSASVVAEERVSTREHHRAWYEIVIAKYLPSIVPFRALVSVEKHEIVMREVVKCYQLCV